MEIEGPRARHNHNNVDHSLAKGPYALTIARLAELISDMDLQPVSCIHRLKSSNRILSISSTPC